MFAVWRKKLQVVRHYRNRFVKLRVRSKKSQKIWKVNEKRATKLKSRSVILQRFEISRAADY